jgi:hypothetical protein
MKRTMAKASPKRRRFATIEPRDNDITGLIGGSLRVRGGDDIDRIIDGGLLYDGRDGDDSVNLSAEAAVGGRVGVRLGEGDNSATHAGNIDGDLFVTSANEDDTVDIADSAVVGGETTLALGEQRGYGRGRFHHGRHGGPRGFGGIGRFGGFGGFGRGFGGK